MTTSPVAGMTAVSRINATASESGGQAMSRTAVPNTGDVTLHHEPPHETPLRHLDQQQVGDGDRGQKREKLP